MMGKPLFSTHVEEIRIGTLVFRLRLIDSLDDAIEYYVETAPDDADRIPYYAILWDAAKALATFMIERPELWPGRRVLELGCGLGLPSLAAARLGAQVTAADYHPDNEAFFLANARLNGVSSIRYLRMDWRRPALTDSFDIVLGSDLIYEAAMVGPLAACVRQCCRPGGVCFLADPGRARLQETCSCFEAAGFSADLEPQDDIYILRFTKDRDRES
ncbi:MAG: methyltransferase domain-containing protein [Lentisphaeria bacterium]|nr:methyltransferase domain-containing protein [Lentisphaeria bacterium]